MKYSFNGIRKAGSAAFRAVLASSTWGAWLLASPLKFLFDFAAGWLSAWLTNKGLLIINVGAIYVNGEFDQSRFDKAFEDGIEKAKAPGLTDAQKRVIDEQVIQAFRRFGTINYRR